MSIEVAVLSERELMKQKERNHAERVNEDQRKHVLDSLLSTDWVTVYLSVDAPNLDDALKHAFDLGLPEVASADRAHLIARVSRGEIEKYLETALHKLVASAAETEWEEAEDCPFSALHLKNISQAADQVIAHIEKITAAAPWAQRIQMLSSADYVAFDIKGATSTGNSAEVSVYLQIKL